MERTLRGGTELLRATINRWGTAFVLCLLLCGGCKDKDAPAEATRESTPAVQEKATGASADAVLERDRLATVFAGLWCLNKGGDRSGVAQLLAQHKIKDVAQWAAQWSQLAEQDPTWSEEVMVRMINAPCQPDTKEAAQKK